VITDLKKFWFRKTLEDIIKIEKDQYNPALESKKFENILKILHEMINKSDNKAEYTFKKVQKYTYLKCLFIF